jgi:alginate O-acetyltransferase complex protein AlgI
VLATVFALPGISLVLHFGLFNFAAGFWRLWRVPTYPLFPAPLRSRSLGEFWGKRWNLPFTEMIQRGVYRPLSTVIGRTNAALAGFLCSGLLHECAISHPVQRGYGLPLLYFGIHGALVLVERRTGLQAFLHPRPVLARVWTLGWLVLPMPLLFHPSFLEGIVWPLVGVGP